MTSFPIYSPAEDSFLLSQSIESYLESLDSQKLKDFLFLDMGTGSGIQAETASEFLSKENIYTLDINEAAVKLVKSKGFKSTHSDLFSNAKLRGMKFNLIVFNPPYLPADEAGFDSLPDTTGGEAGDEIPLAFLSVAPKYLAKGGLIFLLVSSQTPTEKLEKEIKKQNLKKEVMGKKKLFFETLEILKITL